MPRPYLPEALWNYTPMLVSVPVPDLVTYNDPPTVCLEFSPRLIPYIIGLLTLYTWRDKWQGTEDDKVRGTGIINDFIAAIIEAEVCPVDEADMYRIRLNPDCGLEQSLDGGLTWEPVPGWAEYVDECLKGETGPQGPPGETGTPGETGPQGPPGDCDCIPTNPPVTTDPGDTNYQDNVCGIANRLVEFIDNISTDIVNSINGSADILTLVESALGLTAVGDLVVDNIIATAAAIIGVGTGAYTAAITSTVIQNLKCALYCAIQSSNGETDKEILSGWQSEYYAQNFGFQPSVDIWFALAGAIPENEWNLQAAIGNQEPAVDCSYVCECTDLNQAACGEILVDWTLLQPPPAGWYPLGVIDTSSWTGDTTDLAGDYTVSRDASSGRWLSTATSGPTKRAGLRLVFDEPCEVSNTSIGFYSQKVGTKRIATVARLEDGTIEVLSNWLSGITVPEGVREINFSPVTVTMLYFLVVSGANDEQNVGIYLNEVNRVT